MTVSRDEIFSLARELSGLIKENDIFIDYKKNSQNILNDIDAQNLLQKLYLMGRELSGVPSDDSILQSASEKDQINQELQKNQKVKDFLMSQKKYIYLIEQVIDRIRNPEIS